MSNHLPFQITKYKKIHTTRHDVGINDLGWEEKMYCWFKPNYVDPKYILLIIFNNNASIQNPLQKYLQNFHSKRPHTTTKNERQHKHGKYKGRINVHVCS
jgi:hypothetical protein